MKRLVSIHILCVLFLIGCANNTNQIPKSLSSSYDGIWDGYAQTPEYIINSYGVEARAPERLYMKAEIKNGIVSGFFFKFDGWYKGYEVATSVKTKINGYITSDNKLFTDPVYAYIQGGGGIQGPTRLFSKLLLCRSTKLKVLGIQFK